MFNWICRHRPASKPPAPRPVGRHFVMIVDDTFKIRGRGLVVLGRFDSGFPIAIRVHDPVELVQPDGRKLRSVVSGIDPHGGGGVGLLLGVPETTGVQAGTKVWLTIEAAGGTDDQA